MKVGHYFRRLLFTRLRSIDLSSILLSISLVMSGIASIQDTSPVVTENILIVTEIVVPYIYDIMYVRACTYIRVRMGIFIP